jgi:hypothetical protein
MPKRWRSHQHLIVCQELASQHEGWCSAALCDGFCVGRDKGRRYEPSKDLWFRTLAYVHN